MQATLTGDFWVFINPNYEKRVLDMGGVSFNDKVDEFKRYAHDNMIKLIEVSKDKSTYIVSLKICGRTKTDCRTYRDNIIDMFEPYGMTKLANEKEIVV